MPKRNRMPRVNMAKRKSLLQKLGAAYLRYMDLPRTARAVKRVVVGDLTPRERKEIRELEKVPVEEFG